MNGFTSSPIFGIVFTLCAYMLGRELFRRTRFVLFNPLLVAVLLIMAVLHATGISFDAYNRGGAYITFLLGPATVALALPLYSELPLLKRNTLPILAGVAAGGLTALICILALTHGFHLDATLTKSLLPKSITTPLGLIVAQQIGGIPAITVAAILLTGMLGTVLNPFLARILKIKDPIARGIAMGTSSHAIGTAKSLEHDPTEGAMSALAMTLNGLLTVALAPLLWHFFSTLAQPVTTAVK